jgi:putative peptide zinc metalloprotease protein
MATLSANPAFSKVEDAWKTIASLTLRPGKAVHFYKHHYRGSPWLIIADQKNEKYFRCGINAECFLNLLDGSRTVEQALVQSKHSHSSRLLKRDVILLMGNLQSAGLLEQDAAQTSDTSLLNPNSTANRWRNPFAVKFPLINPDRMLHKTAHWFRPLFSPVALFFWVGMVLTGLATVMLNWQALVEHSESRFADPQNFLWYWLLYPLVKGLHEFGHAYATKVWGGAVHEMGITFLVFFPVPYVDSSAAHRFSSKSRRMAVCAAGIMVEFFLAASALLVWVNTDHGLVHDFAFDIVIIAGISTLLFNANPLLRFDGYYLLSELMEIPNLGTRSDQYLGYLFKRYVLDMPDIRTPVSAAGEAKWLATYGICARIYRVFISLFIAFWIAGKLFIIGVLLAMWGVLGQIVYPLARSICLLIPAVIRANKMNRFIAVVSVASIIFASILIIPMSHSTYSEGVVNLPENAYIRASTDGVITAVYSADGESINNGEIILKLEDIELEARMHSLVAQLEETRARQQAAFLQDRSQTDILKAKALGIETDISVVKEQLASLEIVSATAGVVSLPMASDLLGRYVKRGDVMGYVAGLSQISALVAVPQLDIDTVRRDVNSIEVKLSSRPAETLTAEFIRELPQATDRLPNRILGSTSGGRMRVDARDETGMQLLSNIFLVEIALPLETSGSYLGQRIYVRFVHRRESLGNRLLDRFKQLLLMPPFV